jgi:hypothetical protein
MTQAMASQMDFENQQLGPKDWRSRSPENKMLAHLPIIILASLHPTPIADTVPKFDIARECRFEGGTKPMQERCAADETQARGQLQTEWIQLGPGAKNPVQRGNYRGQLPQLRRIADVPRNGEGCEEPAEVTFD